MSKSDLHNCEVCRAPLLPGQKGCRFCPVPAVAGHNQGPAQSPTLRHVLRALRAFRNRR